MRRTLQVVLAGLLAATVVAVALPTGRAELVECVGWLRAAGAAGRVASVGLVVFGLAPGRALRRHQPHGPVRLE